MPSPAPTPPVNGQLRVLIIDQHEISRGALSALLRTEGLHVVGEVAGGAPGVAAAQALAPDLVLLDVAPGDEHMLETIQALQAVPSTRTVVLTSSTQRARLHRVANGLPFLAKADICARTLVNATVRGVEAASE
jgi:DNA-binding NarL/FixJ family response regulator